MQKIKLFSLALLFLACCALPACEQPKSEKEKKEEAKLDSIAKKQAVTDSIARIKEEREQEKVDSIRRKQEEEKEANSETGKLKKALRDKGTNLCAVYAQIEGITANIRDFAEREYGNSRLQLKNKFIEMRQNEEFAKIMAKYGMAGDVALVISLAGMRECK